MVIADNGTVDIPAELIGTTVDCDCFNTQAPDIGGAATRQCLALSDASWRSRSAGELVLDIGEGLIVGPSENLCDLVAAGPDAWPYGGKRASRRHETARRCLRAPTLPTRPLAACRRLSPCAGRRPWRSTSASLPRREPVLIGVEHGTASSTVTDRSTSRPNTRLRARRPPSRPRRPERLPVGDRRGSDMRRSGGRGRVAAGTAASRLHR